MNTSYPLNERFILLFFNYYPASEVKDYLKNIVTEEKLKLFLDCLKSITIENDKYILTVKDYDNMTKILMSSKKKKISKPEKLLIEVSQLLDFCSKSDCETEIQQQANTLHSKINQYLNKNNTTSLIK